MIQLRAGKRGQVLLGVEVGDGEEGVGGWADFASYEFMLPERAEPIE